MLRKSLDGGGSPAPKVEEACMIEASHAVDRDYVPQAMALRRKELAAAYHQAKPGHDCTSVGGCD